MTNGTGKPKHLQEFVMTAKGRDFELCSGGEEDEYLEVEVHSPTDSSEDSVEVKVSPICLRNKRKCAEPRKVQDIFTAPPKKRMCFKTKSNIPTNCTENPEPFRPWNNENRPVSPTTKTTLSKDLRVPLPSPSIPAVSTDPNFIIPQPPRMYIRPMSPVPRIASPTQPLPLVKKNNSSISIKEKIKVECDDHTASENLTNLRVPVHSELLTLSSTEADRLLINSVKAFPNLHSQSCSKNEDQGSCSRKEQRNYKNMTRERRIEANARERTRVHTISAAFETLRRAVPSYSHNQKLSKLSVLRIACSYIMTLSTLVGGATGFEGEPPVSLAECVDSVSKTIQKEGKLRKKKDEAE